MSRRTFPSMLPVPFESAFFPSFQKEMNRLFDHFRSSYSEPANRTVAGATMFPAVDVVDTGEALEISAEVPGVKEDDIDVSITGDVLTLMGEKGSDHEEKRDGFHMIERQYGSFRRQVLLGFAPEDDAVSAEFKDGILNLRIRKPANIKPDVRKIDIRKA